MPRNSKVTSKANQKKPSKVKSKSPRKPPTLPLRWFQMNIVGAIWTIVFTDEETSPILKGLEGTCDFTSTTIFLDKNLKDSRKKDVMTHELLHALIFMSGVDKLAEQFFGKSKVSWEEREEVFVSIFGVNLHDTLTRNGLLTYPEIPVSVQVSSNTK